MYGLAFLLSAYSQMALKMHVILLYKQSIFCEYKSCKTAFTDDKFTNMQTHTETLINKLTLFHRRCRTIIPPLISTRRKRDHARPVCDAAVLWVQLRPVSRALAEHGAQAERESSQDLPRQLVQEERDGPLPLARVRGEQPRARLDLSSRRGRGFGARDRDRIRPDGRSDTHGRTEGNGQHGRVVCVVEGLLGEGGGEHREVLRRATAAGSARGGGVSTEATRREG